VNTGPVGVVVVAAGTGERLGYGSAKALVPLAGRPLVLHALAALREAGLGPPVVVHTPGQRAAFERTLAAEPVAALVEGGATRTASVRAGLAALRPEATIVAVHDAARPLVPADVIRAVVAAVRGDVLAAAPGVPLADTIKRVAADEVVATVDRADLVAIQTPQAFPRTVLERALASGRHATDDLALVEALTATGETQGRVVVVPGSSRGVKVTYPDDLVVAEALLERSRS
jgi:2-C-methyl-D-erythritol 4-phosphate cytidylyltransferase